ncbi:hypothetical protein Micbo1qcDRAFT_169504 [Microdochium bolleyi]|uniref:Uncharacterized protein n=1 Tax=Microdochium bolleyi TaxID=196109 RepID=A0A136IKZ2_9PEZI|nr:hypothetical protein Micbo1qcDRAFT_169504 [Microdochium bolleyi]
MAHSSPPAAAAAFPLDFNAPALTISAMAEPPFASILAPPAAAAASSSFAMAAASSAMATARADLAAIFGLLVIVIAIRTRLTVARAVRAVRRKPAASLWLLVHIAISFFELGRLQWRALSGDPVRATSLDLALGLVHCLSSYHVLICRARAGYRDLIPLGLRLQPFLFRLSATFLAFAGGSPHLHRANVRLGFDAFVYARLLIFSCTKLSPVAGIGMPGPRTLHTFAAGLGGFIATWDSGFQYATLAYVVLSIVSMAVDGRTAKILESLSQTQEPAEQDAPSLQAAAAAGASTSRKATALPAKVIRRYIARGPKGPPPASADPRAAAARQAKIPAIVAFRTSPPSARLPKVS